MVQKFDQGFFDFTKGPNHKDVAGLGTRPTSSSQRTRSSWR
jgi:hypothetical protein